MMLKLQWIRVGVPLTLLLLSRCTCNEGLGSAAPDVPQIDVCVKPSADAAEVCYDTVNRDMRAELCTGTQGCRLPELSADLGRVAANGTGTLAVRVKNIGAGTLKLKNPTAAPGTSNRFRLNPSESPTADGVYMSLGKGEELTFNVELRGTLCGPHAGRFVLESNDAQIPAGITAPAAYSPGQADSPIYLNVKGLVGGPCLCALPPSDLDFGEVPLSHHKSKRFGFTSCGDEALTVVNATIGVDPGGVFEVGGGPVTIAFTPNQVYQPGEQGDVEVTYAPLTLAPPPDFGELWIYTDSPTEQPYYPVPLMGKGIPRPSCNLQAIPGTASFGQVGVGDNRTRTFRIYNAGQVACRYFDTTRTSGSTEFAVTAGGAPPDVTLQPDQSHNLDISYTPAAATFTEALFTLTADDVDGFQSVATISVSGNPTLPPDGCVLDIQPDFGDFGQVTVGGSASINFNITNITQGDNPLMDRCSISSATIASGAPDYRLGDMSIFANFLMPGMATSLTVNFEPESEGIKIGILRFASNDATGRSRDVQLWGNALGAKLCVDPLGGDPATIQCGATQPCATVDFGMTTTEATRTVTLTNCGAGVLKVRGLNMDPAGGLAFMKLSPAPQQMPLNISAGASAQVQIKYRPTNATGDLGGFDIISNASNSELTRIALRGNYNGNCPTILRCSPNPLSFGSQEVGVTAVQTAVCSNFGYEALSVTNASISGDASFALQSATYGDLQPGDSFTAQVKCTPQNPGPKTGTVRILSNACDASPLTVNVECNGIEIPSPACIGSSVFQPREKWRWTDTPLFPDYDDVWLTPVVIQLTDDNADGHVDVLDTPDVIFTALKSTMALGPANGGSMDQESFCHANDAAPAVVVAVSGNDGHELWAWGRPPVGDPADPNALAMEAEGQLAAGDIDGDGVPEIIGVKYNYIPPPSDCEMSDLECCIKGKYAWGSLIALEGDGTFKWESERWHQGQGVIEDAGAPALGDMNGDGFPEISFGNAVFDHNGLLVFEGQTEAEGSRGQGEGGAGHGPISVFADLNGDGMNELIAGRTAYNYDGSTYFDRPDVQDGLTTVANLDGDPQPEIILLTGGDDLYVLEHNGVTKYGPEHVSSGNVDDQGNEEGFIATNPAIGDLDGDGYPEIVVAATNAVHVFEHDLTPKWSQAISDQTGASGPTTFDFEGDGKAEVVHADEGDVWIWDGITGAVKYQAPRGSRTIIDNPVVVDVDNDNHAEILLALETPAGANLGMHGVVCYGNDKNNWVATRRVWNQHSYHITNISESGIVPAFEGPGWMTHNVYRSNTVRCE
ncbi:MAG: choice-of-anchor D domain-containing protein [Deltaproteobacteria bacterium]|nr:choice-of-anchor D domain-containing protein [Deltaproteobacteria bacterium]